MAGFKRELLTLIDFAGPKDSFEQLLFPFRPTYDSNRRKTPRIT